MQIILQLISACMPLYLLCGVIVHDTHIDKVAMHAIRVIDIDSKSTKAHTPHTHVERASLQQLGRESAAHKHGMNIRYRGRKNIRRGYMNDGGIGQRRDALLV